MTRRELSDIDLDFVSGGVRIADVPGISHAPAPLMDSYQPEPPTFMSSLPGLFSGLNLGGQGSSAQSLQPLMQSLAPVAQTLAPVVQTLAPAITSLLTPQANQPSLLSSLTGLLAPPATQQPNILTQISQGIQIAQQGANLIRGVGNLFSPNGGGLANIPNLISGVGNIARLIDGLDGRIGN